MNPAKPLFIHLIGLEGCGHHGIFPIFQQLLLERHGHGETQVYLRTGLRTFLDRLYRGNESRPMVVRALREFVSCNPNAVFADDNSYPSHVSREIGNQWNFVDIHELLHDLCEIRYLRIHRNIFNTVNAHREWDGGLAGHARVLKVMQDFIDSGIAILAGNGVRIPVIDYDHIAASMDLIAAATGCGIDSVRRATSQLFRKSEKDYRVILTSDEIRMIGEVFGVAGQLDPAGPVPKYSLD